MKYGWLPLKTAADSLKAEKKSQSEFRLEVSVADKCKREQAISINPGNRLKFKPN